MATEPGTNAYRDRPGHASWHSRPVLRSRAAGVRMCVGCGSSWPAGRGPRLLVIAKPGRAGATFATAAVTQEPTRKKRHCSREGEVLSLDFESLMCVMRRSRATPLDRGANLTSQVAQSHTRLFASPTRANRSTTCEAGIEPSCHRSNPTNLPPNIVRPRQYLRGPPISLRTHPLGL